MARIEQEIREEPVSTTTSRRVVSEDVRPSGGVFAARVVWFITGVIVSLLVLRMVFQLLGANEGNGVVDFIYGLSGFFALPFFGMFAYEPTYGVSYFETSTLAAIVMYSLLGWGIAKLLTLGSSRTSRV